MTKSLNVVMASRKKSYVAVQAADYMRFAVWRNGDRRKKQQMRDVLAV